MAKVHDKYVVELAEIIKGYGNDPDINDPFCLSTFYRFYEVPNVCVSAENFKKMRPLSDYTEEIEPESISEWKKEFREYVDSLNIARDDWKGIIEYIDELPSAEPYTTTHDSIPAETGKNDGDRTSGDCISRQAAIDALTERFKRVPTNAIIAKDVIENLPSAQPERTCVNCGRTANNGGWYADGGTRCPIEEHYALPKDGYCHLWEKRNVTDDDYPERRTDE